MPKNTCNAGKRAGTGKSQIAYAVARILKLPWTTLDMSSINDPVSHCKLAVAFNVIYLNALNTHTLTPCELFFDII